MTEQEFTSLLKGFKQQTLTAAELDLFFQHANLPEFRPLMGEAVVHDLDNKSFAGAIDEERQEKVWQVIEQEALRNKIEYTAKPAHRIHFFKTSWFRYAAAIVLVSGAAAYFWSTTKKTGQSLASGNTRVQTDIEPGSDRAILTLANGQQIILDSTQGDIIKQGSLTVVNLAGKLKYEGVGTTAEYNTISTPKGGQYQIVLPDGSKVWLNAASSVKFPTSFTGTTRQVELAGEAYMEVARNPKQSFRIKANGAEIQVLGTSFNINAYADEGMVKTTLLDGSVRVIVMNSKFNSQSNSKNGSAVDMSSDQQPSGTTGAGSSVILKPGQQAVVSSGQQLKVVKNVDMEQALAWKNGIFRFDQSNFEEVMRQLSRWYDIEVVFENGVPGGIRLRGEIERNFTFPQILEALGELGVKFRMEGRRLIIMK